MEENTRTISSGGKTNLKASKHKPKKDTEKATTEGDLGTTCHQCGSTYATMSGLMRHLATHVEASIPKSENESEKAALERKGEALVGESPEADSNGHPWPKDGRKSGGRWTGQLLPRDCTQCGKKFATHTKLKGHVKVVHDKIKDYVCDECDKPFGTNGLLSQHKIRVHSTFRPFKCNICYKGHVTKVELVLHMGVHTGEKPWAKRSHDFICGECGKTFSKNRDFEDHKRFHEEGFANKCDQCGKTYNYKSGLQAHIKSAHSGPEEREKFLVSRNTSNARTRKKKGSSERIRANKKDIGLTHSETQMQFLKDLMEEFSGKELTYVLDYVKRLKENGDEEFIEGIIKNHRDSCYRPILMEMGVLGTIESTGTINSVSSKSVEKIEVKVDVKMEADSDEDEVSFEEELNLADDCFDKEDSKLGLNMDNPAVAALAKKIMEDGKMELEMKSSAGMDEDLIQTMGDASPPKHKYKTRKRDSSLIENKTCAQCGITVKETNLRTHMATHLFLTLNVMEKIELSDNSSRAECMECGKDFKQKKNAQEHVVVIHYTEVLNKALEGCSEVDDLVESNPSSQKAQKTIELFNSLNVAEHIKKSEDGKSGACLICGKEFAKLNYIKEHIIRKHFGIERNEGDKDPKPMHVCEDCGAEFPDSSRLKKHAFTHTGLKPFPCPECGKCFTALGSVKQHLRLIHEGIKDFSCDQCGEKFAKKLYLKDHVQMKHSEEERERNWPCEYPGCGQAFYKKGHLDRHVIIHAEEKPYKCDHCDKTFAQNGGLLEHIRVHTGEKPFICYLCGTAFRQTSTLRAHLINVHHEQPESIRGAHSLKPSGASEENDNNDEPEAVKKMLMEEASGYWGQDDQLSRNSRGSPSQTSNGSTAQEKEKKYYQANPSTSNPFYPGNEGVPTDALQNLYKGLLGQGMPGPMPGMMPPSMLGPLEAPGTGTMPAAPLHVMNHTSEVQVRHVDAYRGGQPDRGYWGHQNIKSQYDHQHLNHTSPTLRPQPSSGEGGERNNLHSIYRRDGGGDERGPWSMGAMGQAPGAENLSSYPAQP